MAAPAQPDLHVLGQAPFAVEVLDAEGKVVYANAAYLETFATQDTLVVGRPSSVLPSTLPGPLARSRVFELALENGTWEGELVLGTSRKLSISFRVIVFPVRSKEGPCDYAVVYEDIQHQLDTQNARAHEQNLAAVRARQTQMGELLSMIAHQWRQPLTVVMTLIGNIQLKASMEGLEPEYLLTKLDRIAHTVHFLSETIDAFRNFYAPAKFKTEEDLTFLTRRALELLTPSLQKIAAQVDSQFPSEPVRVNVFAGEFVQVALELITNARDALLASSKEPPLLRVAVWREGETAFLEVANNGGELSRESLAHLYDPYFATREGAPGSGLGLYMAKLVVENHHGGALRAESHDGWTSFICTFPMGDLS